MALFKNLRERYFERQERLAAERLQACMRRQAERKASAVSTEEGTLATIERSAQWHHQFNYGGINSDTWLAEIWEYFTFDFATHGSRLLGWRVNGFSLLAAEHEEILSAAGLLDRAHEGEKVRGYFDADDHLIAVEKLTAPPTTLQSE